nr:hypothetical protein [Tanacetum cinerariifolium]
NQEEIQQVTARVEKWVPTKERVKIGTTNVRLEPTVPQKEKTFQVIIDVIKNSTCFKAFTISTKVPEIFMQQFWHTIKKVKGTNTNEFDLANKKCVVDAKVFCKILNIYPRVQREDLLKFQMTSLLLPSSLILVTKEDFAFQIDNKQLKKGRRKIMPYTRGKGSQGKKFADTPKETV